MKASHLILAAAFSGVVSSLTVLIFPLGYLLGPGIVFAIMVLAPYAVAVDPSGLRLWFAFLGSAIGYPIAYTLSYGGQSNWEGVLIGGALGALMSAGPLALAFSLWGLFRIAFVAVTGALANLACLAILTQMQANWMGITAALVVWQVLVAATLSISNLDAVPLVASRYSNRE